MYHIRVLTGHQDEDDFGERLSDIAEVEYCSAAEDEELIERLEDADIVICEDEPLSGAVLKELDDLKLIIVLGEDASNLDLMAAAERHIKVLCLSDYFEEDVADHTCAMILSLLRQIPEYASDVRNNGRWQFGSVPWPLHRVSANLIGIVGFGRVGQLVAARLKPFGCNLQAYDPFVSEKIMLEHDVRPVDFDKLLKTSDLITLHLPLEESTRNMFQEEQMETMKKGAMLVNCGSGGLVDEAALYHAVDDGHIRSAALDTLTMEHPSAMFLEMLGRPEFLLTPDVRAYSLEAEKEKYDDAERYIRLFVEGKYDGIPFITSSEE